MRKWFLFLMIFILSGCSPEETNKDLLLNLQQEDIKSVTYSGWLGTANSEYSGELSEMEIEYFYSLLEKVELGDEVPEEETLSSGASTHFLLELNDGTSIKISPGREFYINGEYYDCDNYENVWDFGFPTAVADLEAPSVQTEIYIPTKSEVESHRASALEGMSEDEIDNLKSKISEMNTYWEAKVLWDNIFERMQDSNDLSWNYIEQTGEIQTGWAFDGDIEPYDEESGMTYEEFADQYGAQVMDTNEMDADDYIEVLEELKVTLKSDALKADFDNLIENMQLAKETHDVTYMEDFYHILHDMDYYLLRYSPEDVAPAMSSDVSTVTKYYGALAIYK